MSSDIWETIELIDFAEDGAMPVVGGVLDQTPVFLDALRLYRSLMRAANPQ